MDQAYDLVIPVFNRLEYTQACLSSLLKTDSGTLLRPIIVDNGSRRRTRGYLDQWIEEAKACPYLRDPILVSHTHNLGFAAAVNAAVRQSPEGKYAFLMHNDCVPFNGWAGEMLDCLKFHEADDAIVVVPRTSYANETGPCVIDIRHKFEVMKPSNKETVRDEDIRELLVRLYPDRNGFLSDLKTSQRTTYVPEIASFCMVVSKPLLVERPFDEDFWPRFFEDKFWFLPYERQGCICMISNWSYVHHFGNITTDGPGFSMPDLFELNMAKFKEKVRILNENSAPKKT